MVKGQRVIDKLFSKEIVEKIDRQNGEIFEDPLLERFLSLELWKDEENRFNSFLVFSNEFAFLLTFAEYYDCFNSFLVFSQDICFYCVPCRLMFQFFLSFFASTTLSRTELYSLIGQTEIADYIIERREWIEQCMEQGIFLGANLLGYSKFAEKIKKYDIEGALIKLKTKLGEEIEYAIPNIDFPSWQFILGITPLGIGRFTAFDTTVFKNVASRFGYYRGLRQKFRFQSPFTPLVWRKSFEEMRSVHKHRSALKFGTHRYLINTIRNQIKRKLSRLGYDGFTINKYVNAVIDLVYQLRKGHRKSREWKTKLSKEDFKKLWLDKWTKLGLNKSMLLELYEVYIGCQEKVSML